MKKILYLIPLLLLFFIPKVYALPNCSLVSNATLYDVNSASSVSSISTYKDSELLCNTIHTAYATSDASQGLGWSIDLTSINNGNSYYQLDVFMYSQVPDAGRIPIINSSFRGNSISVGTSNPATLWSNGTTNISNLNYNLSTYYDMGSGRTYDVISYIFKSSVNFNKIFIPFATSGLWTGNFDLIGINLINTGQSSLTDTEINNLLSNQSDIIIQNQNENTQSINDSLDNVSDQLGSCYKNLLNQNATFTTDNASITHTGNTIKLNSNGWGSAYIDIPINKVGYYTVSFDNTLETGGYISLYYVTPQGVRTDWLAGGSGNSYSFYTDKSSGSIRIILGDTVDGRGTYTFSQLRFTNTQSRVPFSLYGLEQCSSKLDDTNNQLNDLNNNITNDDVDSSSWANFFNNFDDNDFGLSGIITAPLNTIKTITSNSCTPINLTIPFVNKNMSLPCMTDIYEEHFGSFLDIYQIITFGMISYWVCVQIYAMVKGFKNPDKDEIEVMDL